MIRRWIGLNCVALLAALGVSGCIVEITFDPVGTAASVEGSWTIEGAAPTEASCSALGITHMRVRFYDGIVTYDHPDLVFPCAQGSFDTVDPVVADGVWTMSLVAIDGSGAKIAEGPKETFDTLAVGGHIRLAAQDFSAAEVITALEGAWTIDGAAPTAASCAELGATEVHAQFLDSAGNPGDDTLKLACTDGAFRLEDIAPGAYTVRLVAVDASSTIAMHMPQTADVVEGATTTLTTVDFATGFSPLGPDATLAADWIIGGSDADIADQCAAVGGAKIDLVFYAEDDVAGEEGVIVSLGTCDDGSFDSGTPALAAGTYFIDALLVDASGALISTVEYVDAVTINAGDEVYFDIDFRLESSTIVATLEWEIPSADRTTGTGTYGSCTEAGVAAVDWQLRDGTTVLMGTEDEACVPPIVIDGSALPAGSYSLYYDAEDSTPRKAWMPNVTAEMSCEGTLDELEGGLAVLVCQASYVDLEPAP